MLLEESARLLEPNHKPEFLINARENDGPPAPVGSIVPEGSLLQHWLLRQIFSTLLCLANHADIYHCARDAIRPPPFLRSVNRPTVHQDVVSPPVDQRTSTSDRLVVLG